VHDELHVIFGGRQLSAAIEMMKVHERCRSSPNQCGNLRGTTTLID
jgi:hypothetical protein